MKELIERVMQINLEKGWKAPSRKDFHNTTDQESVGLMSSVLVNIHDEVSEAFGEYKKQNLVKFLEECADIVIRVFHVMCSLVGSEEAERIIKDKIEYNSTRPYRHGNKIL